MSSSSSSPIASSVSSDSSNVSIPTPPESTDGTVEDLKAFIGFIYGEILSIENIAQTNAKPYITQYSGQDTVALFKNFSKKEIKETLEELKSLLGLTDEQEQFIFRILFIIYKQSLVNDPEVCTLAEYLLRNYSVVEQMINQSEEFSSQVLGVLSSTGSLNEQLCTLISISGHSLFQTFAIIQALLNRRTLSRVKHLLLERQQRSFVNRKFSFIARNISSLESLNSLRSQIGKKIIALQEQLRLAAVVNIDDTQSDKAEVLRKELKSSECFSSFVWQGVYQFTVWLISISYDESESIKKCMKNIGYKKEKPVLEFFNCSLFNQFIDTYFQDQLIDIEKLIDVCLSDLSEEQLTTLKGEISADSSEIERNEVFLRFLKQHCSIHTFEVLIERVS